MFSNKLFRKKLWGSASQRKTISLFLLCILFLIFFVIMLRRAWLSDDAYITFRTVDNFVNGYRLTWNVAERVQAYTHPLWMFLISFFYFLTREMFFTSIIVSLAVSTVALVLIVLRLSKSATVAILGVLILTLSNAYVDYGTSGLENPLTHLLLAIFLIIYFTREITPRTLFSLSFTASLAALNRLDSILIFAPALLYAWILAEDKKAGLLSLVLGQIPIFTWEIFSILYYGFPFPNTAYAKLYTGISSMELVRQGGYYLLNSLQKDTITLVVIVVGMLLALISTNRRTKLPILLGMLLYMAYVVKIGGGFMSGRFLTPVLFCAVVLILRFDLSSVKQGVTATIFAGVVLLGLVVPLPTYKLLPKDSASLVDAHGIADERSWYFGDAGLINADKHPEMPNTLGRTTGLDARTLAEKENDLQLVIRKNTGVFGFFAGPDVYVIDYLALSDPLLARLPAIRDTNWRIGHFRRVVPQGYLTSIYTKSGAFEDERLSAYYEKLLLVTSGRLFSKERFQAIWGLNTGQYDFLIDYDRYRYPDMVFVDLSYLVGNAGEEKEAVVFSDHGLEIDLGNASHATSLELALDHQNDYEIIFFSEGREIAMVGVPEDGCQEGVCIIDVPSGIIESGFDRIRFFPQRGDGNYHLNSILLVE
jgi:arabinofuranosyltransferase